jgi:hypothetical protein
MDKARKRFSLWHKAGKMLLLYLSNKSFEYLRSVHALSRKF